MESERGKADPPARTPEELQVRIDEMRAQGARKAEPGLGHAMAFFLSMGITMAGAMYGGYMAGQWLSLRTHNPMWLPIMLLVGVVGGAGVVYKMLKPMLK